MAFVVWVSIYPLITLVFYFFGKELMMLPLLIRTLVLTLFVVPVMIYILLPLWTKVLKGIFRNW